MTKPTAIIFDVDGTLADVRDIHHHVPSEPRDFYAFHAHSVDVPPHPHVVTATHEAVAAGHAVMIVTARSARWRNHTAIWLALNDIPSTAMFMRANDDHRPDVQVKFDILTSIRAHHDVIGAWDDNPAIVELWRANGIPVTVVPGWQGIAS
ncbi:MAG: hypothetical protein WC005_04930 [Candidatus Nanopelagicales bacterium]